MGLDIPSLFPGRVMEEEYWMGTMECWIGGVGGGGGWEGIQDGSPILALQDTDHTMLWS